MRASASTILVVMLMSPVAAPEVQGGDGVIEINQTCAVETGCADTDTPGFPVTIGSGSFKLTSALVVPPEVNGISAQAHDDPLSFPDRVEVSIDLNGFQISSTTTCPGGPPVCSPTNPLITSGVGVLINPTWASGQVHNGVIRGMANSGVFCSFNCIVHDLTVSEIGHTGIIATVGSVRSVNVHSCGGVGIESSGTVENSVSRGNAGVGIFGDGTFRGNRVVLVGGFGINGVPDSVVIGNGIVGASDGDTGMICDQCIARDNNIDATENGIDFASSAALFGGNIINANSQVLLNDANAVQDGLNLCNGTPCPVPP